MGARTFITLLKFLSSLAGKSYDKVSDGLEENPKVTIGTIGLLFLIATGLIALISVGSLVGVTVWHEINKKNVDFYLRCGGPGDRDPGCVESQQFSPSTEPRSPSR